MEQYFQYTGLTPDKIVDQMKPEALKRIKSRLVLDAIVKAENIEVSDEELAEEIKNIATYYGREEEEVKKIFAGQIKEFMGDYEKNQIKEDIAVQKAVDLVVDSVVEK